MRDHWVRRAFIVLWVVSALVLLIASAETLWEALAGRHRSNHIALLAGLEGLGALLYLIPRSLRVGGAALLAALAIAFVVHAVLGQLRWDLLFYAATVLFVTISGAPTSEGRQQAQS